MFYLNLHSVLSFDKSWARLFQRSVLLFTKEEFYEVPLETYSCLTSRLKVYPTQISLKWL